MAKCNLYLYPEPSDKSREDFINLLVKEEGADREKVTSFLATNNIIIFKQVEKEHALELISELESMGITASIDSLEPFHVKKFKKFREGYVPTWNWTAAIFSWLWLLFKGLFGKIAVYWMASWLLSLIVPMGLWAYLAWLVGFVYLGMFGNYDYYLKKAKGEPFWPKFQFQKVKTPFWIIFIVFLGYTFIYPSVYLGTRIANMKQLTISSFTTENLRFQSVPQGWQVFENPPASFSLSISRPTGGNTSEKLSYKAFPDTKLMGFIRKENPASAEKYDYMGLMAMVVKKPTLFQKFSNVRTQSMEKLASSMVGVGEQPFFLKWMERWIPKPTSEISYETVSGREWGKVANVLEMKMMNMEMKFFMTAYWTVIDGKAVILISESFSPYKDEIDIQVKQFLGSLKAG